MDLVSYDRHEDVLVLTLQRPPVNALSLALRGALLSALERADHDERVRAVVLRGAGRGFSAGGDIREFGTPAVTATPRLTSDVHPAIETSKKPIVAALHGYAIGGGLETALACHERVATVDTLIALPEVTLGVIPPSGTQRLPRVVSMTRALEIILTGTQFRADAFAHEPLFSQLVPDLKTLGVIARSRALRMAEVGGPFPLVRRLPVMGAPSDVNRILMDTMASLELDVANSIRYRAVVAVAAAARSCDFDIGMSEANGICEELLRSVEATKSTPRLA